MALLIYLMVAVVAVGILWKISAAFRCWMKFTIFIVSSAVFATAPIPLMLLRPKSSKNALIPAALLRWGSKLFGLTSSVEGHENIIKDSGCVVLINHQSFLDLIVLAELWPIMDNCTVISKKEIFYLQPFGLASWLWGTIFIDRVDKKRAQEAVNETGKTIRDRKARVLMFPEGTRGSGNKLLPFKKGAFHLALASKCPIQPVVVNRYTFLGKNRFDNGHIKIRILPEIRTDNVAKEDMEKLMDDIYKLMSENVDNLSNEVQQHNNNVVMKTKGD